MKAPKLVPVALLLTLLLAACSNQNMGDGTDMAADLSGGAGEPDLTTAPDLTSSGPDLKQLTCGELAVCIISCRAAGRQNCETDCGRNASTDAQTKFGVLALCLLAACPPTGACQMQSSQTCQMCITKAIAAGGACRSQAQSCGLP